MKPKARTFLDCKAGRHRTCFCIFGVSSVVGLQDSILFDSARTPICICQACDSLRRYIGKGLKKQTVVEQGARTFYRR